MPSRRFIVICALLGVLVFGWLGWRNLSSHQKVAASTIDKRPLTFANRTFDPGNPPDDMPPLTAGEYGVCDSNFQSNADVAGEARQTDDTHATVTITHVNVTLQLHITVWLTGAPTQHVIEHEEGHRQISEFYYQIADKLAERIAATYLGKQAVITGTDLQAELGKFLQQSGTDITDEYNKDLNPEPAQLRYDAITDHGRNQVGARDAVSQALNGVTIASAQSESTQSGLTQAATTPRTSPEN